MRHASVHKASESSACWRYVTVLLATRVSVNIERVLSLVAYHNETQPCSLMCPHGPATCQINLPPSPTPLATFMLCLLGVDFRMDVVIVLHSWSVNARLSLVKFAFAHQPGSRRSKLFQLFIHHLNHSVSTTHHRL